MGKREIMEWGWRGIAMRGATKKWDLCNVNYAPVWAVIGCIPHKMLIWYSCYPCIPAAYRASEGLVCDCGKYHL